MRDACKGKAAALGCVLWFCVIWLLVASIPSFAIGQNASSAASGEVLVGSSLDENQYSDRWSWNKSPWRIVPFGALEGQVLATSEEVTGRTTVLYVNEKSTFGSLPQCNIHGQASALGFDFFGPDVGGFHTGGRIYMNFMGDRPLLNQSTPFLVNAYGEMKNDDIRFLFGQYYSLVNPLNPTMINFGLGIDSGNICSYRGQLRVERYFRLDENAIFTVQGAATQPFVTDFSSLSDDDEESSSDNGIPDVNGRIAIAVGPKVEGLNSRTFEFGVSGLLGQSRIIKNHAKHTPDEAMMGCDVQLSSQRFGILGEFFYGYGLSSYGGGIGQSFNPVNSLPIRSAGGWCELWAKPLMSVKTAIGYGIDHPLADDFFPTNSIMRSRNEVYYMTALWDVNEKFTVGVEIDYRKTNYLSALNEDLPGMRLLENNSAMVYWFSAKLNF